MLKAGSQVACFIEPVLLTDQDSALHEVAAQNSPQNAARMLAKSCGEVVTPGRLPSPKLRTLAFFGTAQNTPKPCTLSLDLDLNTKALVLKKQHRNNTPDC